MIFCLPVERDQTSGEHLLTPLVDILRRRRSNGDVKSSAKMALQTIIRGNKSI